MNIPAKKFLIKNLVLWTKAKVLKSDVEGFSHFLTDTRQYKKDSAFVPLKGELDAYLFLQEAYDKGVRVFFIEDSVPLDILKKAMSFSGISLLQVSDTLESLQLAATHWRESLSGKVIAISGSNGKTSTKNFLYQMLNTCKKTYKSPLSFNNHLGVPLSLLEANKSDEVIILEMGMNNKGELKHLVKMAKPDMVLVTQVSQAHIGHFNSLEEVAEAKKELYKFSPASAIGIFNEDNSFTREMKEKYKGEFFLTFGSKSSASQVHIKTQLVKESLLGLEFSIELLKNGEVKEKSLVCVPVLGLHNMNNIGAAVVISHALGLPWSSIVATLCKLKPMWGRMQLLKDSSGAMVVFDAYNANPASFNSALESIKSFVFKGKKIALVGQMGELGEWSAQEHYHLALYIGKIFDVIGFVGTQESFGLGLNKINFQGQFVQSESLDSTDFTYFLNGIKLNLKKEDLVFVKASRVYQFEKILNQLKIKNTD